MSRIDDLIRELCPSGVLVSPLGDVGKFIRGRRFTKADRVETGIPSIHYGEIYTDYGNSVTSAVSHVRTELKPVLRFAEPGDVVVAAVGETVEDVGKSVAWLGDEPIAVHDDCFIFRSALDPKYVVYYLQTAAFNRPKQAIVARAKVKRLSGEGLARLTIPVPPVEVQREIVRVLDLFQTLEAELEARLQAELVARRQQYAYYRDQIFSFRELSRGVTYLPMGELLREPLANGRSVPDGEGYPVLRLTALRGSVVDTSERKLGAWSEGTGERFRVEAGDILVARGNGSKGLIARASMVEQSEEVAFPDTMIRIRPDLGKVSQRYLFHVWGSRIVREAIELKAKVSSGIWKVSQSDLASVVVPVPPLEEQRRIVSILDKFDALVNDLSIDLPAELKARRQQYGYYRDRLLTFREAA